MGNHLAKERIDLSPRTLTLTSVDDKVWLGIPEENLFNDSFTIEKYYMLQSKPLSNFRDADHFKSIELLEDSFFPSYKDRYLGDEEIFKDGSESETSSGGGGGVGGSGSSQPSNNTQQQSSTPRSSDQNNNKPSVPTSASTMSLGNHPSTSIIHNNISSINSNHVNNNNNSNSNNTTTNTQQNRQSNNQNNRQRSGSSNTTATNTTTPTNVNNSNNRTSQNNPSSNTSNSNNNRQRNSTTTTTSTTSSPTTTQTQNSNNSQSNNNNNNNNTSTTTSNTTSTTNATSTTSSQNNNNQTSSTQEKNNVINNNRLYNLYNEELKNRQSIPVYLIDEDPFHTHQITTKLLLEDLYTQSNVNSAYYSTLLQKRLAILKRIHLALKREIARKKLYDSVYHSKAKTRTKKVHTPPISIRIACRLFITTLQEQVFEQRISLPTLKSFNSMIRELPPLSMAGEPVDCIDSLTKWLLSAISTNVTTVKREAMESLISLALSQGSLCAILFSLSLIIMPEKINQSPQLITQHPRGFTTNSKSSSTSSTDHPSTTNSNIKQTDAVNDKSSSPIGDKNNITNNSNNITNITLRLVPFIRQLEQWKVDLPLSPLSRDLLFSTWPILWNNMAEETDDSLAFLSLPNSNIASIASDGEYIYIHDTCGLAKIGTGYDGSHQGRVYARDPNWFPKEKGWMAVIGTHIYYRSPSTEPYSLYVIDAMNLQVLGGVKQDGTGTFPSTNNLTLPFGPETTQSTVDENVFLTPHYSQVTTRSPMFTDGRYLYILSLQRFHSYNNKQFIVDVYDPLSQFNHIKRIELRYPDTDVNEGLVLNPMILEFGSFYTNGHYLMVVIPPSLGSEIFYESKGFVCRAFSLSDGTLVGNYSLENQPIGLASCYDYLNNVVWNYSSSESEIGKYGNEGFGPKHNFPTILKTTRSNQQQQQQSNHSQQQSSNQQQPNNSITTSVVEIDDNYGMEPKQVVSTVLGILSRLAVDYMPSSSEESSTIHHLYKLNESYSVEVNFSTFSQLYSILKHYQSQLRIGYSVTSPKTIDILRCIIYCLRLLKVNLFRLTSNIRSLESSTQPVQDASRDSLLKCIDQTFLQLLRDLLLGFVIDGIEGSTNEIAEFHTIIEESCEVLTIGLDLFYPTSLNKANFVFNLLEQVMNQRQRNPSSSTTPSSSSSTNNQKSNQQNRGYSMLLNSVLSLLANHPNASFFALPPLSSELPSPFSLFNLETPDNGASGDSHRPFDPMNLFVPIITHLIVEAQATIPKQSIPQLSRQDSSQQHLGFSLYSSAPPPPLSNSSPAMRLLLAVQKDLILRVENSVVGTDAPSQALVAYSRLLMDKCKELLLAVLDSDQQPHRSNHQSILLTDFKSSVVGALLPSLIHSLFLFSYHIWLAKELLPSLVQLIGVVDRVNRRLPKLLNRPELGRQPLQKRSSFVEGPIRISESPHPYHPFMNSRQLVSIPNAVFLSLVFDERCGTSSSDDMLQIYESGDSKEPLDQFYLSQWPKRRVLVPGDTVVFQFVTGGLNSQAPHWGYRCNIIGHMPNGDKTSLPWSAHLEKTMCCLAGRFSSCLISGDPVTELERENKSILESTLFSGGCEEEYVSHVLFSQDSSAHPHPHPQPQPQPYPSSEFTTNPSTRAIQRFCVSLARRNGEVYSQTLSDFMWQHVTGERRVSSLAVTKGTIRTAQQAVIAPLLKHLNLGELAIQFTFELIRHRQSIENPLDNNIDHIIKPPQALVDVWRTSFQIRNSIIQKHQENQVLNNTVVINSAEEVESVKRRSVDFKTHATLRETIYKDITDQVTEKAMFLLELQNTFDGVNQDDSQQPSSTTGINAKQTELLNSIVRFVLSNVQLEDMKRILVSRRSRAFTRSIGLQAMRDILRCASDHSMKQEVLCFIGPALRNSGLVRRRAPPFHYLDHLHGCGSRLLKDIKKNFRALMEDIAMLLQDSNSDHTLKYYALDAFTLNFTAEDADLLTGIDIFNKINNLMTTDSIWGGLWSSSSVVSTPTGTNPAGILLHSQSSSSIGSAGSGGAGGGGLFTSSAMIEEEKMEREKLKRTAKALFKFFGLICVDNQNGIGSGKSLDTLRDSFFHFMETQLESSLLFLQEQNKTYWYGCDLPGVGGTTNSPTTTGESTSPPNQQQKNRRLLRGGERNLFNYDFSEGLSLLYILSAFDSVKQRLTSSSFISIFYSILQVGDELQRKLTLRIFRRILPFTSPSKLIIKDKKPTLPNTVTTNTSTHNSTNIGTSRMNDSKNLLTLLMDIIGAISYWGCSSDLLETSKYLDPRFFITSSNYNLFFSSNYSTKFDSTHSFFSIFDKSITLPSCWDGNNVANNPLIRFSDDSKTVTYQQPGVSLQSSTSQLTLSPQQTSTQPPGDRSSSALVNHSLDYIYIKCDNFIPDSLPIFYFEIKIESDNAHCVIGLFPVDQLSQLRSLKEWKYGYGYNGKDGHKLCHRLGSIRSRAYANSFTRNDIVGCGWNRKDGKIFFTKNGKYLGAAFKNVIHGELVPVVMIESGVSVSINFGHNSSFIYDIASLTSSHLESAISERNLPSMALGYVSEVISLVRLLLRTSESWKMAIQRNVEEGLKLLPSTIVIPELQTQNIKGPTIQSLIQVFSVITLLAGHLDGLWAGARVQVELAAGIYEKGTIIEYSQLSNQATVLLDSNIDRLYRTTHPLRVIKPISEVNIDFSQFLPPHSTIVSFLSIFLRPTNNEKLDPNSITPSSSSSSSSQQHQQLSLLFRTNQRNIYLFIKSRAMKVLGSLLKYSECTRYTLEEMLVPVLVEFALGRPIQFLDEPKIDTMERFSFLLKERIYSTSFKSFLCGNQSSSGQKSKPNNNTSNSMIEQEEYGTITEVEFDDDNDMIDIEEFDEIAMMDGNDEDDSLDSIKDDHHKKEKKTTNTVQEEEDTTIGEEEELNNNNAVEEDMVEEGIQGKRIPWTELCVGMSVMVGKREKLGLCRSNWTFDMDRIIGQVGIIKSIDKKHKQVLVTFIDEEIFSLVDWWLCYEIFIYPPITDKSSKHPLQSIDKYSQSQLVHLDASCELALSILFSRQALISLLVSIPSNQKLVSYASFGGAKNLIYILKLTLHTSLLSSACPALNGKSRLNNNLTMLYSSGMGSSSTSSPLYLLSNSNNDLQNLKLLQQKLTLLLNQEMNQQDLEQLSNDLLNSLSSSTSSLSSLGSSIDGSTGGSATPITVSTANLSSNNLLSSVTITGNNTNIGNNSKWKSYKPSNKQGGGILSNSTSSTSANISEPLRTGYLMKQQKILKLWKRVWVVLSGDTLFYYKSNLQNDSSASTSTATSSSSSSSSSTSTSNPSSASNTIASTNTMTLIGSIDLRDIVSVTQVHIMKQPTKIIFTVKKEFCFQVTVASNKTHLFQAKSQEELNEWLQIINSACISSAAFRSKSNTLSSNSLVEVLVKESLAQLRDTAHEPIQQLVEESPHPYPLNYKSKKIIRIDGALALLVVFDPRTQTEPGCGQLKFYYDPCCTDYIGSFSGKSSSFVPTLIQACQFWMVFQHGESSNTEWGYRFTVTPVRLRTSDISLLPQPSFEFACFLLDWILQLDSSFFTSKYPSLFSMDLIDLLMTHLDGNQPFDRKLKVITFITRIISKQREKVEQNNPSSLITINPKIDHLREEMFRLYKIESQSSSQPIVYSQYLSRLIELVIQYELNLQHNVQLQQPPLPTSPLILQSNQMNNPYINNNLILQHQHSPQQQQPTSADDESKAWFYRTLTSYRVIKRLVQGKGFSKEFIKESFQDTRNKMAVDSPHPYPPNVRVTANVIIPRASCLKIEFDPKSKTQNYVDYLMFSKSTPGCDDLGFFTGDFPNQPIIIQGDRFIWSFFSDSSEGEWGFRFYVSPIYSEEIQKENDNQYDQEIEYLLSHPWNHYMDLELVKFVNTLCEKLKKTPSQLIFEQCCTTEYLILYPMLYELKDVHILSLRFNILKHFNECCQNFIQYIDQRGVCEDWSIAYQFSSLRGLLFYDIKMELFMESLVPSQSLGKRPMLVLNRHQNLQDPHDSLFHQAFRQIGTVEPSKLRFRDRAWEVKLEREGARDAGGPYRETITQIISEISSPEMNLFLPCQNAQGDVAFNRDKLVPNSSQTSSYTLSLYEFIGRLIGIAIRTRNCIELSFPSLFWKSLVSAKIDRQDLEAIDKYTVNILEFINQQQRGGGSNRNSIDQEAFNDMFQSFTARSIDNTVVELVQEGRNIPVTWHNRFEYARLVEMYKTNEFKLQIDAIVRGVSSIVPLHLLNIFTWQELELSVCGMPGLDLKLLKRHTRYCGLSANEPRVQWFWRTLESFSSEEQTLFLRFVWGRSRLPPSNEFNVQFQLQVFLRDSSQFYDDEYNERERLAMSMIHENQDEYLPEAQTCFFTLSLPNYSSQEVMREKLLYAITTCRDIDADFIIPDV